MASKATAGIGTKFYRWSSSSEWDEIADVISGISGPSKTRETIEVTTLGSVDGYKEFIGGLRESGTMALTMNFDHETYLLFNTDFESEIPGNYKIVLPDTEETTLEFEGLVTEIPLSIDTGDKITADTTIQITGKCEFYDGSSANTHI